MQKILSNPPVIETERLILRPLTMADDEAVFAYASDPQVSKYVTFETAKSINDSRMFLETSVQNYAEGKDPLNFAAILKKENKLIGSLGYLHWSNVDKRIEIGYALSRPYWNNGYVTEAARSLVAYCFANSDIMRIEARCRSEHDASARVMEKIGMKYEGLLRRNSFIKGEFWDMKIYSILRDEWQR
jgi:ribosomal-protein-alanine N-acetyltransferase